VDTIVAAYAAVLKGGMTARLRSSDKLPLIFTSMLPFEQARQNLARLAQALQMSVTVLGVEDAMANASKLGKREAFVYLSKEDIAEPTRRRLTEKVISQHFR
jgi:hypothetical protein